MTQEKNICTDLGAAFRMKPFYWWSVILTAVSCYGFTLTNHSKGVDDVHMILYFEWKELLRQGRFGTEFLMPFLDISDFIPFWVDFTAVCLFVLGAWLWSRVFLSSMKQKSYAAATIFSCLLISCPYIAHMFVFMPTTIPFGMILVLSGISVWCYQRGIAGDKVWRWSVLAAVPGALAVGFYEHAVLFVAVGGFSVLFLRSFFGKLKRAWTAVGGLALVGAATMVLSRVILQLFLWGYHLDSYSYASRYIAYSGDGLLFQILSFPLHFLRSLWTGAADDLVLREVVWIGVLMLAAGVFACVSRKKGWPLLCVLAQFGCAFALPVVTGNIDLPKRTRIVYAMLIACSAMQIYVVLRECAAARKNTGVLAALRIAAAALLVLLVLNQSRAMNCVFYADYSRYQLDVSKAEQLDFVIQTQTERSDELPVVFVGQPEPYDTLPYEDPLGGSYFNFFASEGLSESDGYINYFMEACGYRYLMANSADVLNQAQETAEEMPEFPKEGAVVETDEYIVVNLGNG